jgi:hypothetical protein
VHTARIVFRPPILSVLLDDSESRVLETAVDFSVATDHQGSACVGFTAATGWGFENHDILSWSFLAASVSSGLSLTSSDIAFPMSACLPGRNLCTPGRAFIEQDGGVYHIILPAHLGWGASIPCSPGQAVVVTNAHGIVCWDLQARGSGDCSGPSGSGKPAGTEFLQANTPAGALITRTREVRSGSQSMSVPHPSELRKLLRV